MSRLEYGWFLYSLSRTTLRFRYWDNASDWYWDLAIALNQCCPTLSPFAACDDSHFKCGERYHYLAYFIDFWLMWRLEVFLWVRLSYFRCFFVQVICVSFARWRHPHRRNLNVHYRPTTAVAEHLQLEAELIRGCRSAPCYRTWPSPTHLTSTWRRQIQRKKRFRFRNF